MAFEDQFLAVLTGYVFHSSQNVYKIIQLALLGTRRKNSNLLMRMLPCLAIVLEHDVIDNILKPTADFPQTAMEVEEYLKRHVSD